LSLVYYLPFGRNIPLSAGLTLHLQAPKEIKKQLISCGTQHSKNNWDSDKQLSIIACPGQVFLFHQASETENVLAQKENLLVLHNRAVHLDVRFTTSHCFIDKYLPSWSIPCHIIKNKQAAKGEAKTAVHLKSHGLSSKWISNYHETMSDNHHFIDLQRTSNHEIQTMLLKIAQDSSQQNYANLEVPGLSRLRKFYTKTCSCKWLQPFHTLR